MEMCCAIDVKVGDATCARFSKIAVTELILLETNSVFRADVEGARQKVNRTRMSAIGTKRTLECCEPMSAFGGKADITLTGANAAYGAKRT